MAYDYPHYSNIPRRAIPITFLPTSIPVPDLPPLASSSPPFPNTISVPLRFSTPEAKAKLRDFLATEFNEEITTYGDPVTPSYHLKDSLQAPAASLVLNNRLGQGRTASVWSVKLPEHEPKNSSSKYVAKIIRGDHIASLIREALFYEIVFPSLGVLSSFVPKYFGTFASPDGGWYVMLLEDAGAPVEHDFGYFPRDNLALVEEVR